MSAIVGEWRLLHWRRIINDSAIEYPLGEDAEGVILYLPDGLMMVQMASADRPKIDGGDPLGGPESDRAAAYSTCLAYFGRYEVKGQQVIHRIEASLYPNWSETTAVRPFEVDHDHLVLRTPLATANGKTVVNEMAWKRVTKHAGDPAPQD